MIPKMAKELIQKAIDRGASDIYLIASKEKYKLYFRQMTAGRRNWVRSWLSTTYSL